MSGARRPLQPSGEIATLRMRGDFLDLTGRAPDSSGTHRLSRGKRPATPHRGPLCVPPGRSRPGGQHAECGESPGSATRTPDRSPASLPGCARWPRRPAPFGPDPCATGTARPSKGLAHVADRDHDRNGGRSVDGPPGGAPAGVLVDRRPIRRLAETAARTLARSHCGQGRPGAPGPPVPVPALMCDGRTGAVARLRVANRSGTGPPRPRPARSRPAHHPVRTWSAVVLGRPAPPSRSSPAVACASTGRSPGSHSLHSSSTRR